MTNKSDFKRSFSAWVEEERAAAAHPSVEILGDYRTGRLAPEEGEPVDEHLTACRECFDLAQDLKAFTRARQAAANGPPAVADFETAAFWRQLRPRLFARPHKGAAWRLPAAVAAAVLVTALGFSFWVAAQHRVLAESETLIAALQAPRPNTRIYDLYLDTSERSGESRPQTVEVPAGSMLLLTPREVGDFPAYAVEIVGVGGERAWAGGGFVPDPEGGTFTLWLPPGFLAPGEYRVRLLGGGDVDGGELIEEYVVRMVP